ncbi:hypothetical protein JL101_036505 (plasmid) [Skermanella rosea]|uniref:hypothetical protein n=1 Tax=Skermanella rosea TaxID=1817965 RepID=UPI0019334880|nr:hypothetical protein [Skermanella rosea]UEM08202.1 hypothetical protein JL101_036505 [Skermanella rosea]
MTFNQGDSVVTPDGPGIVLQPVGTPSGNGAIVCLIRPSIETGPPPVYADADLEPGAPLDPPDVGDPVYVPGLYPGIVQAIEGDKVRVEYTRESHRKRIGYRRQGWFAVWQLAVATIGAKSAELRQPHT